MINNVAVIGKCSLNSFPRPKFKPKGLQEMIDVIIKYIYIREGGAPGTPPSVYLNITFGPICVHIKYNMLMPCVLGHPLCFKKFPTKYKS